MQYTYVSTMLVLTGLWWDIQLGAVKHLHRCSLLGPKRICFFPGSQPLVLDSGCDFLGSKRGTHFWIDTLFAPRKLSLHGPWVTGVPLLCELLPLDVQNNQIQWYLDWVQYTHHWFHSIKYSWFNHVLDILLIYGHYEHMDFLSNAVYTKLPRVASQ